MSSLLFSGVVEDVTEIILNLKQVRFKRQIEDIDNESVSILFLVKIKLQLVIFKNSSLVFKF
jgi:DNA-directed RNA polymerase alpha subunit